MLDVCIFLNSGEVSKITPAVVEKTKFLFFLKVDSSENLLKTSKVLPGKILSKQKTSQIFMNFLEMCQVGAKSERKRFSFMPPVQNKLIFEKYDCEKFNRAFRTEETNFLFSLV